MFGLDSPDRQRTALFALLLLGGAVLFYRYAWSPLRQERMAMEARLVVLERANRQARTLTQRSRIVELERREGEFALALAAYESLLPERAEATALLAGVSSAALTADVEIVSFAPRAEIPGKDLVEIPYDVQVQGSYHEVGRFLAGVINLPQLVRPEVVALTGIVEENPARGEAEHQVLGTLLLSAYARATDTGIEPAGNASLGEPARGVHAVRGVGEGVDEG